MRSTVYKVKLSGLELRRPRLFGSCWIGCQLWQQLGLHEFGTLALPEHGKKFLGKIVLQLLVVSQLLDKKKLQEAEWRDGHYLLRSNLTGEDPAVLWTRYVQLTQIESVFRSLKSELSIRPIGHQLEHRADSHILIAFLAYSLQVTLKNRLMAHASGLTPASAMEKLATIQMIDVCIPTVDGRWLILPRYTQPDTDTKMLLHILRIDLPAQPPPL